MVFHPKYAIFASNSINFDNLNKIRTSRCIGESLLKIMPIRITADGVIKVPSLKSFIGKDADESISKISDCLHYERVSDCIGIKGHRNITLVFFSGRRRIEIVCDSDQAKEVLDESIRPSQACWRIIDIFEYDDGPKLGKGYY